MNREEKKAVPTRCARRGCGATFYRNLYFDSAKKYCSKECAAAARIDLYYARHPGKAAVRTRRACEQCGKEFLARYDSKFCTVLCRRTWWNETRRLGLLMREQMKKEAPALTGAEGSEGPKEEESAARSAAKVSDRSPAGSSRSTPRRPRTAPRSPRRASRS